MCRIAKFLREFLERERIYNAQKCNKKSQPRVPTDTNVRCAHVMQHGDVQCDSMSRYASPE